MAEIVTLYALPSARSPRTQLFSYQEIVEAESID